MSQPAEPRRLHRALAAAAIGAAVAAYWVYASQANPGGVSDFDQLWAGARALAAGTNPYAVVRANAPGPIGRFNYNLYYPLPALIVVLPFAALPIVLARAAFSACSFAVLAFVLTRRRWYPLAGLASGAGLMTLTLAQWSALTTAAAIVPALSVFAATKPNAHVAIAASYDRWRALFISAGTGSILFLVAFLVRPGWVPEWLDAVHGDPNLRPVLFHPLGWLVALALFRWRRRAARWLLVSCALPGTPVVYNALPLFAFPWSLRQTLVLALLSHAAMWPPLLIRPSTTGFASYAAIAVPSLVCLLYLPVVAMLVREPNVEPPQPAPHDAPAITDVSSSR